jgi:hypothetical protein
MMTPHVGRGLFGARPGAGKASRFDSPDQSMAWYFPRFSGVTNSNGT